MELEVRTGDRPYKIYRELEFNVAEINAEVVYFNDLLVRAEILQDNQLCLSHRISVLLEGLHDQMLMNEFSIPDALQFLEKMLDVQEHVLP